MESPHLSAVRADDASRPTPPAEIPPPPPLDLRATTLNPREQATKVAMQDPDLRKNFEAGGFETLDTIDSAAAADYVAKEVTRWKPILAQFKPQ